MGYLERKEKKLIKWKYFGDDWEQETESRE